MNKGEILLLGTINTVEVPVLATMRDGSHWIDNNGGNCSWDARAI